MYKANRQDKHNRLVPRYAGSLFSRLRARVTQPSAAELAGSSNEIEQRHGCAPLSPVLYNTPKSCLVVEIKGARPHALDPRGARAEGADGHGDGAGNVTLHRSDSLHSTSHVAEPAEGSVRPHPLLAGELIDHSLSQQQKRRYRLIMCHQEEPHTARRTS